MTDFVLSAATEADFLVALEQVGVVHEGEIVLQGDLPDGSGQYMLTGPESLMVATGQKILGASGVELDEMVSDGKIYRGLRINGNNPFAAGMPIPAQLTVWPLVRYNEDGSVDETYSAPPVGRIL